MNGTEVRQAAERAGLGYVFKFYDRLSQESRQRLLDQLAGIDLHQLGQLTEPRASGGDADSNSIMSRAEPASYISLPRTDAGLTSHATARAEGEAALRAGTVAALVVAGGQGTRLGFDGPKGAYPIGPVSGRCLFQIFAERIIAARRRFGAAIPWYIMTSEDTDGATRQFFAEHNFFGLPEADVRFFEQGMMPAVDFQNKLILDAPDHIAMSPDGHGGTFRALHKNGALDEMQNQGIEMVSYFQVDNPLVPPLDPVFIGYHISHRSEMSSKMLIKAYPEEKVGVFVTVNDKLRVIEYSDLPAEMLEALQRDGSLRFAAGSIAIHIFNVHFAIQLTRDKARDLSFHRARKKISYVDDSGNLVKPIEPNGIKFEQFIFDALPLASRTMVLEVDRTEEFSPVKNAEGVDSADTARRDMVRLFARRLEEAGVEVPRDADREPTYRVEISPLAADSPEETAELVRRISLKAVSEDIFLTP